MTIKQSGKVNAFAFAQLIKCLREGDISRATLASETGLSPVTVGHYVDELRRAKQVYISSWVEPDDGGRNKVAHYSLGQNRDVKRPVLSRSEVVERYKSRQKTRATPAAQLAKFLQNTQL